MSTQPPISQIELAVEKLGFGELPGLLVGSRESSASREQVTDLLVEWSEGNIKALEQLMPLVFDELRKLARSHRQRESVGHTLQPTALVNEVYMKLVDQRKVQWDNRSQFYAFAALLMRRILVDHAKGRRAAKRGGHVQKLSLDEALGVPEPVDLDILALDDALSALAEIHPRQAKVVELRFFAGLTLEEIGEMLDVSATTVKRDWRTARLWLYRSLREQPRKEEIERRPPTTNVVNNPGSQATAIDARQVAEYLDIPLEKLAVALKEEHDTILEAPTAPSLQPDLQPIQRSLEILEEVYGDRRTVLRWWNSAHPDLGARSPMEVMMKGHGQAIADMLEAALMGIPS